MVVVPKTGRRGEGGGVASRRARRGCREGPARGGRAAFTLVELLIVIGMIAVLLSLLLPVVTRARASANATVCASNLRQLGTAWTMYVAEHDGRLPNFIAGPPATPDQAWQGYWTGILDQYKITPAALLCPSASEEWGWSVNRGMGNATRAWTGRLGFTGSGIKFNARQYRVGSYGYNRYLTAGGGFGLNPLADKVTAIRGEMSVAPLFMDCAYCDVKPTNGREAAPVAPPPDLQGQALTLLSPEHWRFLLARHGRGINVCMVDGSVQRVPLEETYMMHWTATWEEYRLTGLPMR